MYAQCYKQIVEKSPTAQSYILLGDAYMAIQGKHIMFDCEIFVYYFGRQTLLLTLNTYSS